MTILRAVTVIATVLAASLGTGYSDQADQAGEILKASGVRGGLVVHLRSGVSGRPGLTAALRANGRYAVHALLADASDLQAVRSNAREAGPDADVWVGPLSGDRLPYAENMVNLVVAEGLGKVSMDGKLVAVSVADGTVICELKLTEAPVPDGLAAGCGHLLMSTVNGTLTCFGAK